MKKKYKKRKKEWRVTSISRGGKLAKIEEKGKTRGAKEFSTSGLHKQKYLTSFQITTRKKEKLGKPNYYALGRGRKS